jgi:hypothetical protein
MPTYCNLFYVTRHEPSKGNKIFKYAATRSVLSKYQMLKQKALKLMTLDRAPGNTTKYGKENKLLKTTKKVPCIKLAPS